MTLARSDYKKVNQRKDGKPKYRKDRNEIRTEVKLDSKYNPRFHFL